jgi:hypothetical protein
MASKEKDRMYEILLVEVFFKRYTKEITEFRWFRTDIEDAAKKLKIPLPKNIGDVIYSFRFRKDVPQKISELAPAGQEWVIELAGQSVYLFKLRKLNRIIPSASAFRIKIPDATPQIIEMYAKTDEQALLAKVRYNRLIDIFLRVTAYSLQSHLRTTVKGVGQIEVDEVYVGVRNTGQEFIIPVQAKGGKDKIGASQVRQDWEFCKNVFPHLTPRLVAVQFLPDGAIAMFELAFQDEDVRIVDEKHYVLTASQDITESDLKSFAEKSDERV